MASSGFFSPGPFHIISYGTLLGAQFYQNFVAGIVAFRAIPRPYFSNLQQAITPVFFAIQTSLPVVVALTFPGPGLSPSGLAGVLHEQNRTSVLAPIAVTFIGGALNLLVFGPRTTKIMLERKKQETRDGKKSYDSGPHSEEMRKMNKSFSIMHGLSSLTSLTAWVATVWYGFTIASWIK